MDYASSGTAGTRRRSRQSGSGLGLGSGSGSGSGFGSGSLVRDSTALVSTTGRANGTSDVAKRAMENWYNSTYANFSDTFVASATILESVRQCYLVAPEPGTPELTADMLGTRGLNIFLRGKQYDDCTRCMEDSKRCATPRPLHQP